MLQVKTPALVLGKESGYNDEGYITLFTKHFGILRVTAAGVYKAGASLAAWTEPPASVIAEIAIQEKSPGYGRLFTLTLRDYFPHTRSSYRSLGWFYFYCHLLKNFLPYGIKSEKAYTLFKEVLKSYELWENDGKRDFNFIYFLVRLLGIEGICSDFSCCLQCEKQFEKEEMAYFTLSEQGLLCESCSKKTIRSKTRMLSSFTQNQWISRYSVAEQSRMSLPSQTNISLDFLKLLPQEKTLKLPDGLLRIKPKERTALEVCGKSGKIRKAYTNIFSDSKMNDQTLAKVRNFLLIFLAPLL